MGRPDTELMRAWSRRLARLEEATGVVVVADHAVWRVPPDAFDALAFLADEPEGPDSTTPLDQAYLIRLRRAIYSLARARKLDAWLAEGHRVIRKWRGVDREALVAQGTAFAEALDWALAAVDGDATEPAPPGVLDLDEAGPATPVPAGGPAGFASIIIDCDLRTARRLAVAADPAMADRWLRTARQRWWPDRTDVAALEAFAARLDGPTAHVDELVAEVMAGVIGWLDGRLPPEDVARLRRTTTVGAARLALGEACDALAPEADDDDRLACLQLLLHTRGEEYAVPAAAGTEMVRSVAMLLGPGPWGRRRSPDPVDPAWVRQVGPALLDVLTGADRLQPWVVGLSPGLAAEVVAHWPVPKPSQGWTVARLRRYLGLLASAPAATERGRWLRQEWVAELLDSGLASGALGLLVSTGRLQAGAEDAAASLAAGLMPGRRDVAKRLAGWARPVLTEPGHDLVAVAAATGLTRAELTAYLHYRRLAGDGESFPRSVRSLAQAAEGIERRRRALTALLDQPGLPEPRRQVVAGELARMGDPETMRGRQQANQRRLRNQLVRATGEYRIAGLRRTLEEIAVDNLGELPPGVPLSLLGDLVWLAGDENAESTMVRRFLGTVFGGRAAVDWPENQTWIATAGERFDVAAWLAGFDETRRVGGAMIRYRTETVPAHAVHMGTWFDTCLAIRAGFNRTSALTNVVEVNRHVVYGLDASDNVVARKLIAVGPGDTLLGYRSYAHANPDEHRAALDEVCAAFAERCGLKLSEEGEPESLTGSFWYDDGTEPWLARSNGTEASVALVDIEELRGDKWWGRSLQLAVSRHLLSDDEVAGIAVGRGRADDGGETLLLGLWLDGRIPHQARVVSRSPSRDEWRLDKLPLVDPAGFRAAALRYAGPAGDQRWLRLPVDPAVIHAATRLSHRLDPALLTMLSPGAATAYLHDTGYPMVDGPVARLLRRRGAVGRSFVQAQRAAGRRAAALDSCCYTFDGVPAETYGDSALRRRLRDRRTALEAAVELVWRDSRGSAASVAAAAERFPDLPEVAWAAVALGEPAPPGLVVALPEADRTQWYHRGLLRAAVRAGLPPSSLAALSDSDLADLGHPDAAPKRGKLRARWQQRKRLGGAIDSAADGDWTDLTALVVDSSALLADPAVERLVLDVLTERDSAQLQACAAALAELGRTLPERLDELLELVFCGYAADSAAPKAEVVAAVAASIHRQWRPEIAPWGALVALTDRLPPIDQLRVLLDHPLPDNDGIPSLGWVLAARVRRDPGLLEVAAGLPAGQLVRLLDVLCRAYAEPDAVVALKRACAALDDGGLAEVMRLVQDAESPEAWFSLTKRRLEQIALDRGGPA